MGIVIAIILILMLSFIFIDMLATIFSGLCILCQFIKNRSHITHS